MGHKEQLNWFRQKISNKFAVNFKARLGPEKEDDKVTRVLNRLVEWKPDGIYYEADQRHAEIIINELGLNKDKAGISTPGRKDEDREKEHDDGCHFGGRSAGVFGGDRQNYM